MVTPVEAPKARLLTLISKLTVGNLAYLVAQMLAFVALAQFTSTAEVGRFAWGLAVCSPIFALADMRTQNVQLITSPSRYSYSAFALQRMWGICFAIVISAIFGFVFSTDAGSLSTLGAVVLLKSLEGILNVVLGEHIRTERMGLVAWLQVVRAVAFLAPFVVISYLTERVDLSVLGAACALLVPIVVGHFKVEPKTRGGERSWRTIVSITAVSFPLGLGFFINSVTVNAPRFLLERYHGISELAIFTAVSYVVVLSNSVVDSVTQGITPRLAGFWVSGNRAAVSRISKRLGLLVLVLGATAVVFALAAGEVLLVFLYGAAYGSGVSVLIVLLVSATFMYIASVLRTCLIAGGMRRGVLIVSFVNLLIVASLSLLLVVDHGAVGVAVSLAGGQMFALAAYYWLFRRYLGSLGGHSAVEKSDVGGGKVA